MAKMPDPETERLTNVYFDSQAASSGVKTESSTLEDRNKTVPVEEDVDDENLRKLRSGSQHPRVSIDHSDHSTNPPLPTPAPSLLPLTVSMANTIKILPTTAAVRAFFWR